MEDDASLNRPIGEAVERHNPSEDEFVEVRDDGEWMRAALERENERSAKEQSDRTNQAKPKLISAIEKLDSFRPVFMMGAMLLIGLAFIVIALPDIVKVLQGSLLAAILSLAGLSLVVLTFSISLFTNVRKDSFVELDEKIQRRKVKETEIESSLSRAKEIIRKSRATQNEIFIDNSTHLYPTSEAEDQRLNKTPDVKGFEQHMNSLVRSLDLHISLAENKASLLLDKGTTYLWRGIVFYIASIVVWQVATGLFEVGKYAVWGMVSCSLTFLVVEFLAAWFLRQYKSFTDSSFNLVRVKSVFNRYLLSYLAIKEFSDSGEHLVDMRVQMLKVLEEDIKWLEPAPQKAGDLNHMIAMFESVSGLVEKLKVSSKTDSSAAS